VLGFADLLGAVGCLVHAAALAAYDRETVGVGCRAAMTGRVAKDACTPPLLAAPAQERLMTLPATLVVLVSQAGAGSTGCLT
jgi:hypothetical protein